MVGSGGFVTPWVPVAMTPRGKLVCPDAVRAYATRSANTEAKECIMKYNKCEYCRIEIVRICVGEEGGKR